MKLSEAHALWGKEVSRLENLTCKNITTLQDGIDAIKGRVEEINNQERLTDADLDVIGRLELWADAITTLIVSDKRHQDYLKGEVAKHTTAIDGMWGRLE